METLNHIHSPVEVNTAFEPLQAHVRATFASNIALYGPILHRTKTDGLSTVYLENIAEAFRQQFNCMACRDFIRRFGGAVFLQPDGTTVSALWDPATAPELYRESVAKMKAFVEAKAVGGLLYTNAKDWGHAEKGGFNHFHVSVSLARPAGTNDWDSDHAVQARARQNYKDLLAFLSDTDTEILRKVFHLFKTEQIQGKAKFEGWVGFLLNAAETWTKMVSEDGGSQKRVRQWLWYAVARAATGWCQSRKSSIGSLVENLSIGVPQADAIRAFHAITKSTVYQRPTAAPTEGNVEVAEKLIERLGLASALKRRYARVDEVLPYAIWRPTPLGKSAPVEGGVFGHIATKGSQAAVSRQTASSTAVVMTWEKFARTVLPEALRIRAVLPPGLSPLGGLLTAQDPDAGCLIRWDRPESRNPFSWYCAYSGAGLPGIHPKVYGTAAGAELEVTAVLPSVPQWVGGENRDPRWDQSLTILVDGLTAPDDTRGCLFPEILRSELHAIRSTIEAYSQNERLESVPDAAVGIVSVAGFGVQYIVETATGTTKYSIDRWD